jgi:hypothetical protein
VYIPGADLNSTGCHAYPEMIIAVPVIPCVPNNEHTCVTVTAADMQKDPSWIEDRMAFQVSFALYSNLLPLAICTHARHTHCCLIPSPDS